MYNYVLPSGKLTVCDIKNGPVEIVDVPTKHGGCFHGFCYVYQRVSWVIGVLASSPLQNQEFSTGSKGSTIHWSCLFSSMARLAIITMIHLILPPGKRLHNYGKIHHAINGKSTISLFRLGHFQ